MLTLWKRKPPSAVRRSTALSRQLSGRLDWRIPNRNSQPSDPFVPPTVPSATATLRITVKVIVNSLMLGIFLTLCLAAIVAIQHDLHREILETRARNVVEKELCQRNHEANFCVDSRTRAPAMEAKCNEWLLCMHRNIDSFSRLTLLAQYFATAFETFIHGMSWRSIFFIMAVIQVTVPVQCVVAEKVAEIATKLFIE